MVHSYSQQDLKQECENLTPQEECETTMDTTLRTLVLTLVIFRYLTFNNCKLCEIYTVPKVIDFPRYNMKCRFHVLSWKFGLLF